MRPATSQEQVLAALPADGWMGHSELFDACDLTYPAFRSVIFRLKRERKIDVMSEQWRGNGSVTVEGETSWYRLR